MAAKSIAYPPHIVEAARGICDPNAKPCIKQALRFFEMVADFRGTTVDVLLIDTAKRNDPELVTQLLNELEVQNGR